jgi:hypothetical protein
MTDTTKTTRRPRRTARGAEPQTEQLHDAEAAAIVAPGPVADEAPPISKSALVVALLQREHGASLNELVDATGWLPHTTRAALTGLKKKGYLIASEKVDDVRRYRITGKAA